MLKPHYFVGMVILLAAAAACQPVTPTPAATSPVATKVSPTLTATPAAIAVTAATPGSDAGQLPFVSKAVADIAGRLGKTKDQIQVVSVVSDEFPAEGLGCGKPGTKAVQPAAVTGWVIRLQVVDTAGPVYEYHAHGSLLAYCGG